MLGSSSVKGDGMVPPGIPSASGHTPGEEEDVVVEASAQGAVAGGGGRFHGDAQHEAALPRHAVEEQFMESFARVMEQRRSGGGSSSRVSSSPASARAASKPAPEETRWLEGEGALAFAVAMTSSGSSRGSSLQSSRRASPFPSPGRSTTRNGQEQQQQRSLPSSMRASPLPFPQLALDLKRHCSLPPSRRMSPLPSPHSSQQAEQRQVPAHRHDQEERAATPTLSKNAVSLHRQRRPRALLRPLPRVIESASPSKTTTTTTTTGEPVLPDGKTTVGSVPFTADAASQRDAAAYADAGSGLNATGNKMAMMDGASPLLGEGASRDGDEAPQHGEQELSFTVGTIRSTEGDAADGAIQEKTVEEICRECNDRVEEALECGGDAVLCRTLLTVTRRLVDLDQGSKALTSRTYYNLGRLHRSLGECGEAQRNLEASIAAGARPGIERPVVYLELCETFAQQCRWEESLQAVTRAISDIVRRLGLSSVHEITEDSFRLGRENAWLKDAGKGWTEGGDFEGPAWLGRVLALMLHRQGELRLELNIECISCFERAMFVAKHLGTAHSDVAAHTRDSYVMALQNELSSSTGGEVHIGAWDENCPPENRWSRPTSDKPRRLMPMVHGTTKSSGGASKQLRGITGFSFPSKPRQSKVPESPFFIQLASSKALVVQSAYRAHLARRVKQRRMTSWRGLNEILMVRRIQKIWRGVIARRKRAESERLEELALRRSAGLLISTYCIRKLLYSEDVRRLRDDLIGSDEHLAKRVNEFAVQSRPTPLDLGHLSSAAARLGQVPASTHVAESGSQSQREVDRDDAGKTEAMVLLRAYDACAGSSASSFLEGFGYTDDDIEAFFDGCGPSPLGDRSVVPPNLFLQGAAALLERHANQRYTAIEPPPAPTSVGEESTGGDVEVVWKLPVGFDWKSTKVEDCLAQINKIYVYRDMIKSALVIQCGWRSQRSRQAVCEMVGMQRSNVCEQIRRARQLATEREAALQIAQSAKDRVASYATCIQCALRCHMSRARLVLEREYREIFLLNKTQWAIVRLQKSCAKRREMKAFHKARQERSALRLQCCYRQRMARKRLRLQQENAIASRIQLRLRLWYHFRWMRRSIQILPLQRAARCFIARRRLLKKKQQTVAKEALILDYNRYAAHLISAACRGIITRRRFREIKATARQSRSITLLGPFFQGHAARLRLRRLKMEKENSVKRKHYFATKLQNAWRCHVSMDIARDEYWNREASLLLLRHFKRPAARKLYGALLSKDTFASTIQNAFRARLARKESRRKRAGRMISNCALRTLCRNRMVTFARDFLIHDLAKEIGFDPALVCLHCLEAFAVGARCRLHSGSARAAGWANREEALMQKNAPFLRRAVRSGPTNDLPKVEFPPWLDRSKASRSQAADHNSDAEGVSMSE